MGTPRIHLNHTDFEGLKDEEDTRWKKCQFSCQQNVSCEAKIDFNSCAVQKANILISLENMQRQRAEPTRKTTSVSARTHKFDRRRDKLN